MPKFALCNREVYRNESMSIHREGCSDIAYHEIKRHGAHVTVKDLPNIQAAIDAFLTPDIREMGYDESHVKVNPCCKDAK